MWHKTAGGVRRSLWQAASQGEGDAGIPSQAQYSVAKSARLQGQVIEAGIETIASLMRYASES